MDVAFMNSDTLVFRPDHRIALFNHGFRLFILLAGITSSLLVPLWIYTYARGRIEFGYYSAMVWHGHEMIFGYTVAVIAGFLLTAMRPSGLWPRYWRGRPAMTSAR